MKSITASHLLSCAMLFGLLLGASGCSTPPTHPELARADSKGQLAELIPVRQVVANRKFRGSYLLSPDGKRMIWLTVVGTGTGLAVGGTDEIESGAQQAATSGPVAQHEYPTGFLGGRGDRFGWLADSRHAWYYKDRSGAENVRIEVIDTQTKRFAPWVATPWPGAVSRILGRHRDDDKFYLMSNKENKSQFDLYVADISTRTTRLVTSNDGSIYNWGMDPHGRIAVRVLLSGPKDKQTKTVQIDHRLVNQPIDAAPTGDPDWRDVATISGFDGWWIDGFALDRGELTIRTNIGRDKIALMRLNLITGEQTELFAHQQVDITRSYVAADGQAFGALATPDYTVFQFFETPYARQLKQEIDQAVQSAQSKNQLGPEITYFRPSTASRDGRRLMIRIYEPLGSSEWLLNRDTRKFTPVRLHDRKASQQFAANEPFEFTASDGQRIAGYIVRPVGVTGPVPLIVSPHGGPWRRDTWRSATRSVRQLLVNRGYAILMPNFRGSTGYGRRFVNAANRQYATRLQLDISEAAQWAIDKGYADPNKIAVIGGSFGGYSTLMQLIDQPHPYACGVNIVGVANWPRLLENLPPYWRAGDRLNRLFGDPRNPDDRAQMWQGSPMSRIDKITAPLLVIHGANDVRVAKQDSEDVVAALRKLNRPVQYLVFNNEGHSIRRWRNKLTMWRRIEDFLADCLGGRSAGFDWYQLVP